MGVIKNPFRKKQPEPDRREYLLAHGRITDGVILDIETNDSGEEVAIYLYTLNGVDFESSDVLTEKQRSERVKYAPGAHVGIRYDQRNQGNSILE
jgi:hypothetical protein